VLALSDADRALGLANKLMGQVNLVRFGAELIADRGSFTLTSGVLSRRPMPGGAAISLVNAGLEGFVAAAALELPRGVRINAVAPGWVRETLVAMKMDPAGGTPAAVVAHTYVQAVEGRMTGQVLDAAIGYGPLPVPTAEDRLDLRQLHVTRPQHCRVFGGEVGA
jgi:NAD(P)-dependent dehydrogenase (short-subunit alcohol dehydrogenase family)